jgi:5S rRNA maturation endonuclease (ribonuclease M5)
MTITLERALTAPLKPLKFGFIVEGFHDEPPFRNTIGGAFPIVVLGGDSLQKEAKTAIQTLLDDGYTLFIATDPDEAGYNAAEKINSAFPEMFRLKFDADKCMRFSGKNYTERDIGVQHTTPEHIVEVIESAYDNLNSLSYNITVSKFYGNRKSNSAEKRVIREFLALGEILSVIRYGRTYL